MNTHTIVSQQMIDDFVLEMEHKGLHREAIQSMLFQAMDELEDKVVAELMNRLSDDKLKVLDALIAQGASSEEIAKQLEISQEDLEELENEKFADVIDELTERI